MMRTWSSMRMRSKASRPWWIGSLQLALLRVALLLTFLRPAEALNQPRALQMLQQRSRSGWGRSSRSRRLEWYTNAARSVNELVTVIGSRREVCHTALEWQEIHLKALEKHAESGESSPAWMARCAPTSRCALRRFCTGNGMETSS